MRVFFATGNAGKVASMREHVDAYGIEVQQVSLQLVEPQASNVEEIALSKAKQAYEQLHQPVLVEDSGFYVEALHGFPGPYTKYVLETIGVRGLLRLLEPHADRSCYFLSVLAYIDEGGGSTIFRKQGDKGALATYIDETSHAEAWSDLWRVFIPSGSAKPLSALTGIERESVFATWRDVSVFAQFARWISQEADLRNQKCALSA